MGGTDRSDAHAALLDELTDAHLLAHARAGDEGACRELVARFAPAAHRVAAVASGSRAVAADVGRRTVADAIARTDPGDGHDVRVEVLRTARRLALDITRRLALDPMLPRALADPAPTGGTPPDTDPGDDGFAAGGEGRSSVVAAYVALDEPSRTAIWLATVEHLDARDVAAVLGAPTLDEDAIDVWRMPTARAALDAEAGSAVDDDELAVELASIALALARPLDLEADTLALWRRWLALPTRSRARDLAERVGAAASSTAGEAAATLAHGVGPRAMAGAAAFIFVVGALAAALTGSGDVDGSSGGQGQALGGPAVRFPSAAARAIDTTTSTRTVGASSSRSGRAGGSTDPEAAPHAGTAAAAQPATTASVEVVASTTPDPTAMTDRPASPTTSRPPTIDRPPSTTRSPTTTRPTTTRPTTTVPSPSTTAPPTTGSVTDLICGLLPICP